MWPLPVGELFGVGPAQPKSWNSCGIYTIGNLAAQDRATVVSLFGGARRYAVELRQRPRV